MLDTGLEAPVVCLCQPAAPVCRAGSRPLCAFQYIPRLPASCRGVPLHPLPRGTIAVRRHTDLILKILKLLVFNLGNSTLSLNSKILKVVDR